MLDSSSESKGLSGLVLLLLLFFYFLFKFFFRGRGAACWGIIMIAEFKSCLLQVFIKRVAVLAEQSTSVKNNVKQFTVIDLKYCRVGYFRMVKCIKGMYHLDQFSVILCF